MFLQAALSAFAGAELDERRTALLDFLAAASADGQWRATEALTAHLATAAATPDDVATLRARGATGLRAMACAHRHTLWAEFTAAAATMNHSDLASAALGTTDPARLHALLELVDPTVADAADVIYHAASHPEAGAGTLRLAVQLMDTYLRQYPDDDAADLFAEHLRAHTPASVATAVVDAASADPRVHPLLLSALVTPRMLPAHPLLAGAAARAAVLHAADLAFGQELPDPLPEIVATVLTSPLTPPALRAHLAQVVTEHQTAGTFLLALTHGDDPADPETVRACPDPVALAALSVRWRTVPPGHLLELISHPLLPDEIAARTLLVSGAAQRDVGAAFGRTRATARFRALCWLEQEASWRIPASSLTADDVASVVELLGHGARVPVERTEELSVLLDALDDDSLRALPWSGACWATAHATGQYAARLGVLLRPVTTRAGLPVLAAMPDSLTVGQVLDSVSAALDQPMPGS